MVIPDYRGGSIVNLMGSVLRGFGVGAQYPHLRLLSPAEVASAHNVILLVVDGLGYNYVAARHGFLKDWLCGKITSVFPSTTAACVTSFFTGVAPQQHALTGWFTYMKEVGSIVVPLRFCARGRTSLGALEPKTVYPQRSVFDSVRSYLVHPQDIAHSAYNQAFQGRGKKLAYSSPKGFFRQIRAATTVRGKKFIYAYWPYFDTLEHQYGPHSSHVEDYYRGLDRVLSRFATSLAGTNTLLMITADHGQVRTRASERIDLAHHKELAKCLTLPLSGDSRAAYCYVRPSRVGQFLRYTQKYMGEYCDVVSSAELVKKHYFGLYEPSPRLSERIGDYTLIMKGNYVIRDFLLGEKRHFNVGNHGGVSEDEMYVPFVAARL